MPLLPSLAHVSTTYVTARFDDGLAMALSGLNYCQRGIYVCMNKLGKENGSDARTDANVAEVRAIFADFDDGLPGKPFPIPPTALVQTSVDRETGIERYQAFWRCKGVTLDEFDAIEQRLVLEWKADPASVNLSRIQRLPGYWHQKYGIPFLVEIVEANDVTYSREEILAAFPPVTSQPTMAEAPAKLSVSQRALSLVKKPAAGPSGKKEVPFCPDLARDLLRHIPAKSYELEYWPVIAAMKRWAGQENFEAREIAREWAMKEPGSYDQAEFDRRWSRADEDRAKQFTAGTLFHLARQGGWTGSGHLRVDADKPGWMQKWINGGKKP